MNPHSTKHSPHHEEKWTGPAGMKPAEVADYVRENYGHGSHDSPVGYSYDPENGALQLFFEHARPGSVPIGHNDEPVKRAQAEEASAKHKKG